MKRKSNSTSASKRQESRESHYQSIFDKQGMFPVQYQNIGLKVPLQAHQSEAYRLIENCRLPISEGGRGKFNNGALLYLKVRNELLNFILHFGLQMGWGKTLIALRLTVDHISEYKEKAGGILIVLRGPDLRNQFCDEIIDKTNMAGQIAIHLFTASAKYPKVNKNKVSNHLCILVV